MPKGNIQNVIRRLRFENNEMTQQELANEIGVTRQTIIAIEAEKYCPSLKLAFCFSHFFKCSIEDIFTYTEPVNVANGKKRRR